MSPDYYAFARKVLIATVTVLGGVALVMLLWYSVWVLLLIFAGVLVAVALRAVSDFLSRLTGLGRGSSLLATVVLLLGIAAITAVFAAPSVTRQANELVQRFPESIAALRAFLEQYPWGRWLLYWSPPLETLQEQTPTIFWRATNILYTTLGAIFAFILVLFVGLYLAADTSTYTTGLLRMAPMVYRPRLAEILGVTGVTLRRWLLGQFIAMLFVGVTTFIGLWLLEVPLALILAVLAFLLEFVPNFGPIVAAVPAILLALADDPEKALWVALLYLVIQQLEGYLITPLVQRRTVSLPPVLTISSQVLLGLLAGPLGLLLATPLIAVVLVLVKMLYVEDTLGDRVATPEYDLTPDDKPALPEPQAMDAQTADKRRAQQEEIDRQTREQAELKDKLQREENGDT